MEGWAGKQIQNIDLCRSPLLQPKSLLVGQVCFLGSFCSHFPHLLLLFSRQAVSDSSRPHGPSKHHADSFLRGLPQFSADHAQATAFFIKRFNSFRAVEVHKKKKN